MCQQNFTKLWRRCEFIVHNHLWTTYTDISFLITDEIPRLYPNEFNRKYLGRLQKRTLKTSIEFQNCNQQIFTLTMCLTTCLCAQIARTPFNYTITARTRLARLIPQFPALGKNYRIASMLIITRALNTPRDDERRERGSMFCETNQVRTNRVESMKTQRWKVPWPNNEIDSFCSRIIAISLVSCLHHTCALGNLILRCLTGSHMTILSKSNYLVRLNVNMNIGDSISLHFNFGKCYYFFLWVKQQIFDEARFF